MSMRRIKHCLMTAACAGLFGLFATNALGQAPAPAPAASTPAAHERQGKRRPAKSPDRATHLRVEDF